MAPPLHWDDLRFVLALARAGSLAKAARALTVDHTTVGRRIDAIEAALGVALFLRTPRGYVQTADAERLLPSLERMEDAVLSVQRGAAEGGPGAIAGPVCVTAPTTFGTRFVAPRLGDLRTLHPEIVVDLRCDSRVFDLRRREADVALRFFRSREPDLVVRRIATVAYGLYGADAYFARRGTPRDVADLRDHDLVSTSAGFVGANEDWLDRAGKGSVVFRTNSAPAALGATAGGLGLCVLPCFLGDREPTLRRLAFCGEPDAEVWLTVHQDLRRAARVRAVMEYLVALVEREAPLLRGETSTAPTDTTMPRPRTTRGVRARR